MVEFDLKRIDEVSIVAVSNVDKKTVEGENIYRVCNYMDVYKNEKITNDLDFMLASCKEDQFRRFQLHQHDVIITKDSELADDIANAAYVSEKLDQVICGYHLAIFKPQKDTFGPFLSYSINSKFVKDQFTRNAQGLTRFGLTLPSICSVKIPFPPLPEQKKIAVILSTVDEAIQNTKAQIEKTKELKQGLMQKLFSEGIGHTEFKDSKLGRIPKEWEVVRLGNNIDDRCYGPRFSSKDYLESGNVKTIRGTDINKSGDILYDQVPTALLPSELVESHKLSDGDLVMITTADCGLTGVYVDNGFPFIASAYAVRLSLKNSENSLFYKYLFQTNLAKKQITKYIRKGTVANLALSDILKFEFAFPSKLEQSKIVKILLNLDLKMNYLEDSKRNSENIKKGLMQKLLTGEVRVMVN